MLWLVETDFASAGKPDPVGVPGPGAWDAGPASCHPKDTRIANRAGRQDGVPNATGYLIHTLLLTPPSSRTSRL